MIGSSSNWQGQYRIAMLCRPTIRGEMYGVLTTLHSGRGSHLTPAACPLALIPERNTAAEPDVYGRIARGNARYETCRTALGRVSEDAYALFFACPV